MKNKFNTQSLGWLLAGLLAVICFVADNIYFKSGLGHTIAFMPIAGTFINLKRLSPDGGGGAGETEEQKEKREALELVKQTAKDAAIIAITEKGWKNFDPKDADTIKAITDNVKAAIEAFKVNDGSKDINLITYIKEIEKDVATALLKMKNINVDGGEKATIKSEITSQREKINEMLKQPDGQVEITIKATTNRASVSDNAHALDIPGIGQLATRKLSLYEIFPKFPVGEDNNGTVRYYDWDEATTVRAAATIAEGGVYPESTAKWKTYTLQLQKIGDSIPMTEEFMYDDAMFAAELEMFLLTNVDLVVDSQIYSGDNTGSNLKGMTVTITPFVPVIGNISWPTIYDLIPKVIESIVVTGGSKYSPNVAIMNRATINQYKLTKDQYGQYLIPPFVSKDGSVIDGCLVIESNIVANNKMFVGDNRFARIYEVPGILMERGRINDDFTHDIQRLKVRRRLNFLIRNADLGGWKYVTDIAHALDVIGATT